MSDRFRTQRDVIALCQAMKIDDEAIVTEILAEYLAGGTGDPVQLICVLCGALNGVVDSVSDQTGIDPSVFWQEIALENLRNELSS